LGDEGLTTLAKVVLAHGDETAPPCWRSIPEGFDTDGPWTQPDRASR
jgi:hypothetical protein